MESVRMTQTQHWPGTFVYKADDDEVEIQYASSRPPSDTMKIFFVKEQGTFRLPLVVADNKIRPQHETAETSIKFK